MLSSREAGQLVDEVGSDWVGIYLDTANMMAFGFPEHWIRDLGARIKKVHLKDFVRRDQAWVDLMDGDTDILGQWLAGYGWPAAWKDSAVLTWVVILAMDTWHWTSLVVILAYSALTTIPDPLYQAAAIDGARPWQVFRHIQLPRLQHVLLMAVLLRFMDSFMIYIEAFRINAGGPNNATTFLSLDLGEAINGFSYGSAAAHSVIYFLMVLTIAWAFRTAMDRRGRASSEAMA